MNAIPPGLICVRKHTSINAHAGRTQNVKKKEYQYEATHDRTTILILSWHEMCSIRCSLTRIVHKYNCSDTTLQLTWSKHSIHNYYNMFINCRFLCNNIAIIMTLKIHRACCLTEIYLNIDRANNLLFH